MAVIMELHFIKLSGAGNDFIAIDDRDHRFPENRRRNSIRDWCRRGLSVGADGVLVVEPADDPMFHFKMRYYNADGSEGETCGNGSRCIAKFAYHIGAAPADMKFETMAGPYQAQVHPDGDVTVAMTDAHSVRENISITDEVFSGNVHFINTGVPHTLVFVENVEDQPVEKAGRHLRHHNEFAPAGTNVNFVQIIDQSNLSVRTYERGVEAETLACGTGCIASCIMAAKHNQVIPPVRVKTRGNEFLTIGFDLTEEGAQNVTLKGSANIIFKGVIEF